MTAPHFVDPAGLLGEALAEAAPDLMRQLQTMINALLSADADAVVGAEWGRPTPSRTAQRNGYRHRHRHRDLDTRVGTIDVAIPKLRQGTYFPEWLLERRKSSEAALITVVADCYLAGVSTRRMDKFVKTLGIDSLSKSQVSRMADELDEHVEQFRHRPLDAVGPFTFVAADALTIRVAKAAASSTPSCCSPPASTTTATAKSSRCSWPRPRPARRGTSSSPTSSHAACPGSASSPQTPTKDSSRRSQPTCPAPAGNAAAPTAPRT